MAKKRRKVSKAAKLAHYKSLKAQMEVNGIVSPIQRARYAKYVNAIKKLGGTVKSNPRGFGGAMLGRDRHGRFVKSNPHGAHGYGHAVGSYAKKGKRKVGEFFGGMAQGWRENPAMSFPQMGVVHNPYGGGLFGPKSNPKRHKNPAHWFAYMTDEERKEWDKAVREGRKTFKGQKSYTARLAPRDSKGRFVPRGKRNPHRRGHRYY